MMTFNSWFLSLALLTPTALAKDLSAADLRKLQDKMQQSDSLTLDFVQTSFTALRGKSRQRRGRAQFSKTGMFRWMLETPVKEYKIYDGKSFYDFNPETQSAVRYKEAGDHASELRQIVDLVLNFDSLLKKYDLIKAEDFGDTVMVQLRPKDTATELTQVELILDIKKSFISNLKFALRNKNTLSHEFSKPDRSPLPESTFKLPQGVKVSDSL